MVLENSDNEDGDDYKDDSSRADRHRHNVDIMRKMVIRAIIVELTAIIMVMVTSRFGDRCENVVVNHVDRDQVDIIAITTQCKLYIPEYLNEHMLFHLAALEIYVDKYRLRFNVLHSAVLLSSV